MRNLSMGLFPHIIIHYYNFAMREFKQGLVLKWLSLLDTIVLQLVSATL